MSQGQNLSSRWDKFKGNVSAGLNSARQSASNKIGSLKSNDPDVSDSISTLTLPDMIVVLSPILIAIVVTALSFFNQNWKGIIYLAFLIGACLIRNIIYRNLLSNDDTQSGNKVCDTNIFTKYEKGSFSPFVFAFTIVYLFMPMFINKGNNWWLFSFVIVWFAFDVYIRYRNNCIAKIPELFINVLSGGIVSGIIVVLMNLGGSKKYLFFNETQNGKETCSQPSKQTFKCDVYKDGKLVQTL